MSIFPYVYYMIKSFEITSDDQTIALYAGMVTSAFAFAEFLAGVAWGRLSDKFGRKPILLCGLAGTGISMVAFGFSKSLPMALIARALGGLLNGNIGVIKSIMGEMTDDTNIARAFAYQPIAWSTGSTLGPLIGGSLSRPAEKFPETFGHSEFFRTYPYFLPCAIPATFTIICWTVVFFFLEEVRSLIWVFR